MRTFITIALGLALIAGSIFITKKIIANKNKPKAKIEKIVKKVSVDTVTNKEIPIVIEANGTLTAKYKIELFAEVQGILSPSKKEFKAGTYYGKGETLMRINSEEFFTNLQSKKSNFYSTLITILPDIQFDFPDEYEKWRDYSDSLDMNSKLPPLPAFSTDKEKYFILSKGLITLYYDVNNLEIKLEKHVLTAPYSGIVTEALVTTGTLIRVGQKLGEFINPNVYEVEVSVNAEFAYLLKMGASVTLHNLEKTKKYIGKVIRISGIMDAASQTVKAYIQVAHKDLREGLYLMAELQAQAIDDAIEISRKLLIDNKQVFAVRDSVLELIEVDPVYFTAESVVIKGVKDGMILLSKSFPTAYDGMKVEVIKNKK